MTDEDVFLCPAPVGSGYHDKRHIATMVPDPDGAYMLDNAGERYRMLMIVRVCDGCGCALTSRLSDGNGTNKWARYVIEEEPF